MKPAHPHGTVQKIRFNVVLGADTFRSLREQIPSGSRSRQVENWIEEGLKMFKHGRAVENIRRLRKEGLKIPDTDKRSSTEILREFRYSR